MHLDPMPMPVRPFAARPDPARAVARSADTTAAAAWLRRAAALWATVAVLGQLWMAFYIAAVYGRSAARGDFAAWNSVLPHGFADGTPVANAVLVAHVFAAGAVYVAGGLQLLPWLRRHAPRVHRASGRVFLVGAVVVALGGTSMKALRDGLDGGARDAALYVAAALILWFATQAYRTARARRFDVHRRWALRLWLAMGTVWFLRLGVFGWLALNGGRAVGFDPATFSGPALTAIVWSAVLLPQLVLHAYLRAGAAPTAARAGALAATLALLAMATLAGIGVEATALSGPRALG